MSKRKKNKNQRVLDGRRTPPQSHTTPEAQLETETNPKIKPVPKWKNDDGTLIKLKRAAFPYNRAGIIAYCDYRIEYWQLKKAEMLKKADPVKKLERKKAKLIADLAAVETRIEEEQKTNS